MELWVEIASSRKLKRVPHPRLGAGAAAAWAAAILLSGCAAMAPRDSTPFNAAVPVPPPRAPLIDPKTSAEHGRMIALFDGEYRHPPAEAFLNEILVKLAQADERAGEPYKVTILNSPAVNAFALPPGNLYVTRGLLALANDASELAAVMAHEIAHITARHAMQREEEEKRAAVISQAASAVQSKQKSQEVEARAHRTIASFSRNQELEADQIGIRAAAKAGYDPYGASRFLTALGKSAALRKTLMGPYARAGKPDILATHPSTPERLAQAVYAARQIGAPGIGRTGRVPYLDAIEGMTFGDDPGEGVIRGRKFLHGRLGFAFLAPEGFTLENASQALLGINAGGDEALRLDSVSVPPSTSLAAYIASGWIDGLIKPSIAAIDVNGMSAAIANATAGEWQFSVAAIRFDQDRVYRLIFAARVLTDQAKQRFKASIDSFHRVAGDELSAARPLKLAIVTANAGDTPETLAARIAMADRALDHFLLINGLARGEPLQNQERYKSVVE
ncbi:MAG: M48 family metalloprotease [Beijerinckiaceae bacterium]|nr:M48 family metalloprotease [Beijerinckiaceae bacterium]